MLKLFIVLFCVSKIAAITKTVCDCTDQVNTGILQFADGDCDPATSPPPATPVDYSVYTEQRGAVKFPAYVCGRWKVQKHITIDFFGTMIVVPDKIALETSATECQIMQQSLRCNDEPMTTLDKKWTFNDSPAEKGYWYQTVTVFTINCMLEEISLFQENENDTLSTPLGMANAKTGVLSHNHLTVIWDATYTSVVDHKPRLLEEGSGLLNRIGDAYKSDTFRLRDDTKQLDFHVKSHPRCLKPQPDCIKNTETYNIVGENHLYIIIKTEKLLKKKEKIPNMTLPNEGTRMEYLNIFTRQWQYMRDQITDQENYLSAAVHSTQCDMRKLVHAQAVSTAQYNGWLAASQLQLPMCTKLSALGQTVITVKCRQVEVTFSTNITKCGPQPRYKNFTINLDGWELVPYKPCYWTTGFVNFNNDPHAFRNNTWTPVEATIVLPNRDLADTFRYKDVKFTAYQHQSNPAYWDTITSHMNIMADIAASMNEHSEVNETGHHAPNAVNIIVTATEKRGITTFSSWFESFKIFCFTLLIILVILLIIRGCYAVGLCGVIWKACCKPPKKQNTTPAVKRQKTPAPPTGIELKNMKPMLKTAARTQVV